jgi:hypothetical protein
VIWKVSYLRDSYYMNGHKTAKWESTFPNPYNFWKGKIYVSTISTQMEGPSWVENWVQISVVESVELS